MSTNDRSLTPEQRVALDLLMSRQSRWPLQDPAPAAQILRSALGPDVRSVQAIERRDGTAIEVADTAQAVIPRIGWRIVVSSGQIVLACGLCQRQSCAPLSNGNAPPIIPCEEVVAQVSAIRCASVSLVPRAIGWAWPWAMQLPSGPWNRKGLASVRGLPAPMAGDSWCAVERTVERAVEAGGRREIFI